MVGRLLTDLRETTSTFFSQSQILPNAIILLRKCNNTVIQTVHTLPNLASSD